MLEGKRRKRSKRKAHREIGRNGGMTTKAMAGAGLQRPVSSGFAEGFRRLWGTLPARWMGKGIAVLEIGGEGQLLGGEVLGRREKTGGRRRGFLKSNTDGPKPMCEKNRAFWWKHRLEETTVADINYLFLNRYKRISVQEKLIISKIKPHLGSSTYPFHGCQPEPNPTSLPKWRRMVPFKQVFSAWIMIFGSEPNLFADHLD